MDCALPRGGEQRCARPIQDLVHGSCRVLNKISESNSSSLLEIQKSAINCCFFFISLCCRVIIFGFFIFFTFFTFFDFFIFFVLFALASSSSSFPPSRLSPDLLPPPALYGGDATANAGMHAWSSIASVLPTTREMCSPPNDDHANTTAAGHF